MKNFLILFLIFASHIFVACSNHREVLRFNLVGESLELDWTKATDASSSIVIDNIMEGLTTYGDQLRPEPALAASWSVLDAGKLYRFILRDDVFWSDGRKLEAMHFVDAWERLLDPQTKSGAASLLYDVVGAQLYALGGSTDFKSVGVRAIDSRTLEVRLRRPVPYFLHLLSKNNTFPIRKDLLTKFGSQWATPKNIVTLGAYRIADWVVGDHIELLANPKYWIKKIPVEKVILRIVTEPVTALSMYENDELDIIPRELPFSHGTFWQQSPDYRKGAKLQVNYLAFNIKKPPFDKAENRKAFIQMVNREELSSFLSGSQTPTKSWIPPGLLAYRADVGLTEKKEIIPSFKKAQLLYSGNDSWSLLFQSLQKKMKEKNVSLSIENADWKSFQKQLKKGNIIHLSLVASYPDPHSFMNVFTSTSESNFTGWQNARYDHLIELATATEDESRRIELYTEAQRLLLEEEAVIMPLFVTSHQALIKPYWSKVALNPLDKWYFKNIR